MFKKDIKKFLRLNKDYLKEKRAFTVSPEDSPLIKRLGKKIKHPMHEWYEGNLLKRVFIIRVFGFELSLFREVNNV